MFFLPVDRYIATYSSAARAAPAPDEIFVRIVRVRQSSAVNVAVRRPIFATKKGTKDFRRAFWPPARYKTQRLRPTAGKRRRRATEAGGKQGGRVGVGETGMGSGRRERYSFARARGKAVQVE